MSAQSPKENGNHRADGVDLRRRERNCLEIMWERHPAGAKNPGGGVDWRSLDFALKVKRSAYFRASLGMTLDNTACDYFTIYEASGKQATFDCGRRGPAGTNVI